MNSSAQKILMITALTLGGNSLLAEGVTSRKAATTTPAPTTMEEQAATVPDAELTRRIRKELMNKEISQEAKSVTVITIDGMAVLKGVVPNAGEKSLIGDVATRVAPNVRNEIVVKQ